MSQADQKRKLLIRKMKKILIFVVIVGLGGTLIMKIRVRNQAIKTQEMEEMSVGALKSTFKDIESVEFFETILNDMTGIYTMYVRMTSTNGKSVQFDYMFQDNDPDDIGGWGVIDEENVQKEGKTIDEVKVIYSNGEKGEV